MIDQRKYFLFGALRVGAAAIAVAVVFFALSVIGYLAIQYDVVIWAESVGLEQTDSYWDSASTLALVGALHVFFCAGIALITWMMLKGCYYVIIYIGGYREPEDQPC